MEVGSRSLLDVIEIVNAECFRQKVGPERELFLLRAYAMALVESYQHEEHCLPTCGGALLLARVIEPKSRGRLRTVPVTFLSGGWAADWTTLPTALPRLFDALDWDTDASEWTKAFLDLHPLIDGNGRLAWLLYNWINRSLAEPVALPRFDFAGSDASV